MKMLTGPRLKNHTGNSLVHVCFVYVQYVDISRILSGVNTWENQPMSERKAGTEITEIMPRLPDQSLILVMVFIEASKSFMFNFLFEQASKKYINQRRMYIKHWFNFLGLKILFIWWSSPFKLWIHDRWQGRYQKINNLYKKNDKGSCGRAVKASD